MDNLKPGDRVVTLTGRQGIIKPPTINMPNHHLIQLDSGEIIWVVKYAVSLAPPAPSKRRRKVA